MSNVQLAVASWFALLVHLVVGAVAWRRSSALPLVPLVNLAVALCVVGYWMTRWYGYAFRGIAWYWSDQWVPLYGIAALCVAGLSLAGRVQALWPNAVVFGVHTLLAIAAVLFATFFRVGRLF